MTKEASTVINTLKSKDGEFIGEYPSQYCFDFLAKIKENNEIILIKIAEKLSDKMLEELKKISNALEGIPLVIEEGLEEDIIYSKRGMPMLNTKTLEKVLKKEDLPLIYINKGGVYVKINPQKFREKRKELGYSIGELAYKLGVSRKAAMGYERGEMDATISMSLKLEKLLGDDVFEKLSIEGLKLLAMKLSSKENLEDKSCETKVSVELMKLRKIMNRLGFKNYILSKSPFQLASKKIALSKNKVIARTVLSERRDEENIITLKVARLTESKALLITPHTQIIEDKIVIPISPHELKDEERLMKKIARRLE